MLNEVWSHLIQFGVLACALCRRRIKFFDVSVLSDDVRFSNMGTEWGGYHLRLLFGVSSLSSLCATLMSLTLLMGDAQFASVSVERTSVVRRSYFSVGFQCLLLFVLMSLLC